MGESEWDIISGWRHPQWGDLPRRSLDTESGRGQVRLMTHPLGSLIERQYRHGGLHRHWFPELFLKSERAGAEFNIHKEVFQKGIATVEPVGWCARSAGLPLVRRYYYYTRFLPDAQTLPAWMATGQSSSDLCRQMALIIA